MHHVRIPSCAVFCIKLKLIFFRLDRYFTLYNYSPPELPPSASPLSLCAYLAYFQDIGLNASPVPCWVSFLMLRIGPTLTVSFSLRFNGNFPGRPGSAGSRTSPFWILLELRVMEIVSGDNWSYKTCKAPVKNVIANRPTPSFLQAACLSCRETNSVKARKVNFAVSFEAGKYFEYVNFDG